ncbi:MAG: hypothetical protein PF636_10150 [Actinomycetota bacterium]|nr:hypothetical protein [Actinomycetota bacterium]
MSKAYDITTAARGEIRTGGAVVKYDLDAGRMPDGVNPLVLEHLIGNGIAVPVKKTTPKKGAQQ